MATYYVDPNAGSDSAAGTAFGTAWATTQKALDTVAAGDEVRLCKSATETISAIIDLDTTSGTNDAKITIVSYAADGSAPSDGYTISTSSSIGALVEHAPSGYSYYRWIGVTFDANDSATNCYLNDGADGSGDSGFLRCIFKDAGEDCFAVRGNHWHLHDCEITGAARYGISHTSANRGNIRIQDCKVHHNANTGWKCDRATGVIRRCLFYRNGGWGVECGSSGSTNTFISNTFYGNTSGGLKVMDAPHRNQWAVSGNTFVANGTYGYNQGDTDRSPILHSNNHHYGNTSGGSLPSGGLGSDLITGDPLFTSTTDGSEDFTPAADSPLVGAGFAGQDIGARSAAPGGGGGGTVGFAI